RARAAAPPRAPPCAPASSVGPRGRRPHRWVKSHTRVRTARGAIRPGVGFWQ
ncbi:MerR family bacterial regulatory protein, partial [Actinomyces sp. oral taxon 178 str. F0338]